MREFARAFYNSKEWRTCSRAFMQSRHYVCDRCGGVAVICHHKNHLSPENINNPAVTLNWENLEALCMDCHNLEHMRADSVTTFAEDGSIASVTEGKEIKNFQQAAGALGEMLQKNGFAGSTKRGAVE